MAETIFFDESGNSGENLLDPNQPFYCIGSIKSTEETAKYLLGKFNGKGQEIHFKNLKKYTKFYDPLFEVLNDKFIAAKNVKCYAADKEFALVCQIVDRLIEPVYYRQGIDLYRDGEVFRIANRLYYFGHTIWDNTRFFNLLTGFQSLVREQTPAAIKRFYDALLELLLKENMGHDLVRMIYPSYLIINDIVEDLHKNVIDLAWPLLMELCDNWTSELKSEINIVHDQSKQVDFWKSSIAYLSNKELFDSAQVGFADRKITFPLRIKSLTLVDSKESPQIQLVDLLTSSLTYALASKSGDDALTKGILGSKLGGLYHNWMTPDADDITRKKKSRRTDVNPLDYIAHMAQKNRNIYDPIAERLKRKPKS
jgi:hypothetical protein